MNPFSFLKQLNNLPTGTAPFYGGGDGIRREVDIFDVIRSNSTLDVLIPTTTETNALIYQIANNTTNFASFVLAVPKDYDPTSDEFKIVLTGNSAGNTDSPTLTATAYRKRLGTALTAALTVKTPLATFPKSATPATAAAEAVIDLSGNKLLPGDVLSITLTFGSHTTDAMNIYRAILQYKTNIVFSNMSLR